VIERVSLVECCIPRRLILAHGRQYTMLLTET
jgi:hypothetical protein